MVRQVYHLLGEKYYIQENTKEIEKNFYHENGRYRRLFNKEQFDILTKDWDVIVLNEDITIRLGRKKALWEFILEKQNGGDKMDDQIKLKQIF